MHYVARYLNIDGKVNQGDVFTVISGLGKGLGPNRSYEYCIGTDKDGNALSSGTYDTFVSKQEDIQRVKLFLCMTDLKVGDSVIKLPGTEHEDTGTVVGFAEYDEGDIKEVHVRLHYFDYDNYEEKITYHTYREGNVVKKICEISDKAIWVRNLDKIWSEYVLFNAKRKEDGQVVFTEPKPLDHMDTNSDAFIEMYTLFAVIKNPSCHHFH
jgi:hypothetical protein